MSKYFFGGSVKSNRVRASAARTFGELVKKHLDAAVPLRLTRKEYNAIPSDTSEGKAERLNAKDTTYLVACVFDDEETSRERKFAEKTNVCNLLFLDLDTEKDGRSPAAPYIENPDILLKALRPFNFAAYLTASSTPEKPRMRIVVDADNITLDAYPAAVKTIAERIGLGNITKESLTPNQPMICPSLFADQDPDSEHPMVVSFLKGDAFTLSDVQDTSINPEKAKRSYAEDDGLEYLRAPLMGVEFKDIASALETLSPNCGYQEWFEVCCALRHQFSDTEQEEEAFSLFDEWSSQGDTYPGPDGARAKWDAVYTTPRGRVPVTIRTLIKRAADAGWNAGKVKEDCFKVVNDWINDDAKTLHEMTHIALERIAQLPILTHVEEGTLLNSILRALTKLGEKGRLGDLKKDLEKLKKDQLRKSKAPEEAVKKDPAWTKGWFYVACYEKFFRPSTHQWRSKEAFNAEYSRFLLTDPEQLEAQGKDLTDTSLYVPPILPNQYLLNKIECPVVDDTTYDPTSPKEIYSEDENGLKLVNTYRACYPKAKPTDAEKAGSILQEHLRNLIAETEYQRVILDYIAFHVQNPGKKCRWAPLMQGGEGIGKTLWAILLGKILGEENVMYVNNEAIRGNWNEWAVGAQLIVIGEVRVAGHNRHDIMNKLKELVTDDFVSVNKKHADTRKHKNITNYIMFTNHHDALAVMAGSRRYFVIKSKLQTEEQVAALGPGYFDRMFDMIENLAGGLRSFFETWEISPGFNPNGRAPKTKYLEEMIEDSADEVTSAIRRTLRDSESPLLSEDMVWEPSLMGSLTMEGLKESPQRIGKLLREEHYLRVPGRPMIDGMRGYLWIKQGKFDGKMPAEVFQIARDRAEGKETNNEEDFC
jgi:hypothetical protein